MISKLLLLIGGLSCTASAFIDKSIVIQGKLVSLEEKIALVETEKGRITLPASAIRGLNYKPGQNVLAYVDFKHLIELNKALFQKAKLLKE